MRRIRDKKQVEYWLQKGHIRENFDTENLPFSVCRFEKGEYLTRQGGRLAELLFLIEGEVQIYGIREDGSVTPVNRHEAPALLGDAEFVMGGASSLFTEARTTVICAALPMEPCRAELDRDVKFLHLLLRSYAGKFHTMATLEASAKGSTASTMWLWSRGRSGTERTSCAGSTPSASRGTPSAPGGATAGSSSPPP